MPKTKISEFSATPGNNTDIDGINIAEGCAPSGINDAIRELMSQLKDFQAGTAGDSFNGPVGTTTAAAGAFTTLSATGATTLSSTLAFNSNASVPTATAFAFQPTNNAIAFGTANTERMRINSDGNVGIQNTGPSSYSAVDADNLVVGPNSGSNGITVVSGTTGTGSLAFADGIGTGGTSDYAGLVQYDHSADNMNFFTGATERMRLNSSGLTLNGGTANGVAYLNGSKVLTTGSALTFDGSQFYVNGGASGIPLTLNNNTGGNTNIAFAEGGTAKWYLRNITGNGGFSFYDVNAGSEQMRLTSTGLGIGTSSPGYKLGISGVATTYAASASIALYDTVSGVPASRNWLIGNVAAGNYGELNFAVSSAAGGAPTNSKMTLDSSGNLGLGVTPSAWDTTLSRALQLNGGSLWGYSTSQINVLQNAYYNASGNFVYTNTAAASAYRQISGAHSWLTAASGTAGNTITFTQAMTLDASGNLMVGRTTTSAGSAFVKAIDVQGILSGAIYASATDGGTVTGMFAGDAFADVVYAGSTTNHPLAFLANNTERARITSGGEFLFSGLTTSVGNYWIQVKNTGSSSNCAYFENASGNDRGILVLKHDQAAGATTGAMVGFQNSAGTTVGTITSSNTATAYNTSSDYRLKDNQQPLTGSGAFIDALQPKTWEWKTDGSKGVGFIAHEVQAVSPASVVGKKDAVDAEGKPVMQAMEYGSAEFIANIIAELKSLRQRVAALEAK